MLHRRPRIGGRRGIQGAGEKRSRIRGNQNLINRKFCFPGKNNEIFVSWLVLAKQF